MERILIARHQALADFLTQHGIKFNKVIEHATAEDVKGKDVYGVLPLHLAALTNTITSVDLNLPAEMRGKELTIADVGEYFNSLTTYKVSKIESTNEI